MKLLFSLILLIGIQFTVIGQTLDQTKGKASYYSDKLHGRSTASGEKYDKNALTAAHRTLPFGTFLKITNLKNMKSTIVKVNDRGPRNTNYLLDISRKAAEEIDMISDGHVEIEIKITKGKEGESSAKDTLNKKTDNEDGDFDNSFDEFNEDELNFDDSEKEEEEPKKEKVEPKKDKVEPKKEKVEPKKGKEESSSDEFDEEGMEEINPPQNPKKNSEKELKEEKTPAKKDEKRDSVPKRESKHTDKRRKEDTALKVGSKDIAVQVSVFADRQIAEKFGDSLHQKGFKPFYIQPITKKDKTFYRILILQYPDKETAAKDIRKLEQEGLKPIIKHYKFECK